MKTITLKIVFLLLFFTISSTSYSQDIDYHNGEETSSREKEKVALKHYTDSGVLLIKGKRKPFRHNSFKYILKYFDENMNLKYENTIEFPDKKAELEEFKIIGDQIYAFFSKYERSSLINTLYGAKINAKGEFEGDPVKLLEPKRIKKRWKNRLTIEADEDLARIYIISSPFKIDDEPEGERTLKILDENLQELRLAKFNLTYKNDEVKITKTVMDSTGNLHILSSQKIIEEKGNIFRNSDYVNRQHAHTIYWSDNQVVEYPIGEYLNGEYIGQVKLKVDDLGNVQYAGLYSGAKRIGAKGVFAFTIDLVDRAIVDFEIEAFTTDFIRQFLLKADKAKMEKENLDISDINLKNFVIRDLVMKEGGGYYLVAEFHQLIKITSTKGRTKYFYSFNHLIVVNVLEDNTIKWNKMVYKIQKMTTNKSLYLGVVLGINKDNSLNIVYNARQEYADDLKPKEDPRFRLKNTKVVLARVYENAEMTKQPIYGDKRLSMFLIPGHCIGKEKNNLILYLRHAHKVILSHVTLN